MILFEMGFIGFALWLSVIISILLTGFKNLKNKQYNVLLFSLVLFFMSFGNDTIYKKYWWIGLIIMFINIKNTAEVNYNE
jgi:O-antigen ligase